MNVNSNSNNSIPDYIDVSQPNLFVKETIPTLLEWAKTQPAMVHMLEIDYYPLLFVIIDMRDDQTFDIHLRREPETIIDRPPTLEACARIGYEWFQEDSTHLPQNYSWEEYKALHDTVNRKINGAIMNHHGVVCTTITNNQIGDDSSAFVLHFGDVLITKLCDIEYNENPHVYLQNSSFSSIPDNFVDSLFLPLMGREYYLSQSEIVFLIINADIYFHIYCYWYNDSNKPIRCQGTSLRPLRRSQRIIENEYFQGNQIAKLGELTRKCQGDTASRIYLV